MIRLGGGDKIDKELPRALPGYEHINRYWDRSHETYAAKILPGEYYVSVAGEMITTVLGSCVSACIRDAKLGIGGMNHFMLPNSARHGTINSGSSAARYGSYAMEVLINDILKAGGKRSHLEVKLFGGGQILARMTDIGRKNIDFVKEFMEIEQLNLLAEDLGGIAPRKVLYYPDSGRARVKVLKSMHNDTVLQRESTYLENIALLPDSGEVELF